MASKSSEQTSLPNCPECQGIVVTVNGETFCQHCGLVVDDQPARPSPKAQYGTDADARKESRRVGIPSTQTRHDKGLTTQLNLEETDALGNVLSADQRSQLSRLERTQRWFGTDSNQRRLREGLSEVQRLVEALDLPKPVHEDAAQCYRKAREENLLRGRSIESIAGACVYIAAQRAATPRTYADIESISRVDILRVKRSVLSLQRSLDIGIAMLSPQDYVSRVVANLDVPPTVETEAIKILNKIPDDQLHSGPSLVGWAAAAVYRAAKTATSQVPQEDVSDAADVSKRTIQHRLQDLDDY